MSKEDEMIKFVESNCRLEGMSLSASEKQTMKNCLNGTTTFRKAIKATIAKHRRSAI